MTVLNWENMPFPATDSNLDQMRWIVPARNNIQRELLRLRVMMPSQSGDPKRTIVLNWLAGIGFSLWRSVFQAREGLNVPAYLDDAQTFLGEIILDNAVVYRTELNTWSLGYYLGNARLRIMQLSNLWPYERNDNLKGFISEAIRPMVSWEEQQSGNRNAYKEWESCFHSMREMLNVIEQDEPQRNK